MSRRLPAGRLRGRKIPSSRGFLTAGFANLAALGAAAVLGIYLQIYVAATFDADGLAFFAQITATVLLLGQVATFGLHQGILYFAMLDGARAPLSTAILASLALSVPIGLLYIGAHGSGLVPLAADWSIGAALPFFAISRIALGYLYARGHLFAAAALTVLRFASYVAIALILGAAGVPYSALGLVYLIGEAGVAATGLILSAWLERGALGRFAGWRGAARQLRFAAPSCANGLLTEALFRVEVIALAIFASTGSLAVYSFALVIFEGLVQIFLVLRQLFIRLITAHLIARRPLWRSPVVRAAGLGSAMALTVGVASWLLYPAAARLFGLAPEFQGSRDFLFLLGCAAALGALGWIGEISFNQIGRPHVAALAKLAVLACSLMLNLSLVPALGATGAVWALITTQTLFSGLIAFQMARISVSSAPAGRHSLGGS